MAAKGIRFAGEVFSDRGGGYLYGLRKDTTVTLANGLLEQCHISRKAKYRCLKALEDAGLIAVEYRKHRNPRVTIVATGLEETAG